MERIHLSQCVAWACPTKLSYSRTIASRVGSRSNPPTMARTTRSGVYQRARNALQSSALMDAMSSCQPIVGEPYGWFGSARLQRCSVIAPSGSSSTRYCLSFRTTSRSVSRTSVPVRRLIRSVGFQGCDKVYILLRAWKCGMVVGPIKPCCGI